LVANDAFGQEQNGPQHRSLLASSRDRTKEKALATAFPVSMKKR
jgi:hypothetical protein